MCFCLTGKKGWIFESQFKKVTRLLRTFGNAPNRIKYFFYKNSHDFTKVLMVMIKYVTVYRSLLSYQKRHGGMCMESTILANITRMDHFSGDGCRPKKPGVLRHIVRYPQVEGTENQRPFWLLDRRQKSRDQRDWRIVLGTGKTERV
jgi:hypothetical protein